MLCMCTAWVRVVRHGKGARRVDGIDAEKKNLKVKRQKETTKPIRLWRREGDEDVVLGRRHNMNE